MTAILIFIGIAYLLGSLSSAVIVCKLWGLPDPRQSGSMNPGATNVLRIGGKLPALLSLVGDFAKGLIPVILAHSFTQDGFLLGLVALAAFLGHLFPLFFKFAGGKGVATALGAWLALAPSAGLLAGGCWIITAVALRYSSLAALMAAVIAPVGMLFLGKASSLLPTLAMTALLVWRHKANIQRLRAGTETKINL